MLFLHSRRWSLIALLAGLLAAGLACPVLAAEEKPADEQPAEKADPFVVPKGTPEELLKYLQGLGKQRPTAENREAVMEFFKKRSQAMIEAADSILDQKPTADQAKKALGFKLGSLQMLGQLGDADAAAKVEAIPDQLQKAGLKELLPEIRGVLLQVKAQRAQGLGKEEFAKVLEEVKSFLAEQKKIGPDAIKLAMGIAMAAEHKLDKDAAAQTYRDFGKLLATSDDKNIAAMGATMEGAARRMQLVGNEITIQGKTLDGKEFDWGKYKDKVVLIDFFATWCGPCRAEMPNVAKNYDAYHDKGFEVVTISLDRSREDLEKYLEEHKHSWAVLLEDPEARGTEKSMSTYYGVFGIPQMILVGKNGKVLTLNARGPALGEQLEKLLGPPAEKKAASANGDEDQPVQKKS